MSGAENGVEESLGFARQFAVLFLVLFSMQLEIFDITETRLAFLWIVGASERTMYWIQQFLLPFYRLL